MPQAFFADGHGGYRLGGVSCFGRDGMRGADLADEIESLHAMMQLRDRERLVAAGLAQTALGEPRLIDGPHRVGVVAKAVADATGASAAVAKRQRNRVLGLPRHDPGRPRRRCDRRS